jgi:oligoribonuclease NrnB/cAMP/cGMP phosphodiesterase (DHH superfamily)
MKTIAIYHKDCTDGTSAAAVVLKKFSDALLFPLSHGFEPHELEPILSSAQVGDSIYMVDCALGVQEFLQAGHKVTIIDHHAGIEAEMTSLAKQNKNVTYIFDNSKSGASLCWSYFFPKEKIPEIIKLVEDADIWKWEFGNDTKYVGAFLYLLTNKPHEVLGLFDSPLEPIKEAGKAITAYTDYVVDSAVAKTEPIYLHIGNHKVPFYNITTLKSESGNKLSVARGEPVALFSIDGNKVKISFRSTDGQKTTALMLAQELGGGGHKNAAGAGMPLERFIASIAK